ncbi:MAG TPA: NUDIX hydrolase [Rectinemataceae bacterium]|nr:NUDIX hydrolase [Rectinemataceae bacterium]
MVAGDGSGALLWTRLSKEEVYRGAVFSVFEQRSSGPEGREGRFQVLEARDWAVVVPLLRKGPEAQFLMVRQYRHGSDKSSLEFPGGVIEAGESPEKAAARELAEETGWIPSVLYHAGTVFPNPAIQSNRFHVYLALDPFPAVDRNLDEDEVVDALLMSAKAIHEGMGEGELSHALMATALFLAEKCMRLNGIAAY